MPLTPGTRFGVYDVIAQVGEGGMGQVFRARDTKLHRDVALKVLPDALADDAERCARFMREAQTLASLNHPAIAHLHGFEESGRIRALVMEFVDGDDLSQRIARGAIPIDDALPIAKQIAQAIEAAHEQGIIHRDLKPANIKLRPDGVVKVLDFGLAKALAPEAAGPKATDASQSPTITGPAPVTGAGVVLGTAAYMSPEQAKGLGADKRSDIWAFGCVLYEMLTGKRPFDGEDATEVAAAVVRLEPGWESLPAGLPPSIRALLQRCLVKDRRKRIGDVAAVLFVLDHHEVVHASAPVAVRPKEMGWRAAALAAVAVAGAAALALRGYRGGPLVPEVVQFTIEAPEAAIFGGPAAGGTGTAVQLAVSPDGRNIVFVAATKSVFRLWLRPLSSADARPMEGTEGGTFPFWSPDGQSVGFFADGKLKRVPIVGGPATTLADAPAGRGGAWSRDNVIVIAKAHGEGLFRVSARGGAATPVTRLADEDAHRWPSFLPDGRHFVYTAITGTCCPAAKPGAIRIGSLDPSEPATLLFQADSSATYAAGHLLFARDESLMAQAFDPVARRLVGDAVTVSERVSTEGSRYVSASLSEEGTLVYARASASPPHQLTWFDREGVAGAILGDAGREASIALSPDERRVALALFTGRPPNLDIWTIEIARKLRNRVTTDLQPERSPVWSPDGTRIVFGGGVRNVDRPEKAALFLTSADGTSPQELLVEAESTASRLCGPTQCGLTPSDWSADGRYILYTFSGSFPITRDIWALPLFGDRKPFPVVHTAFREGLGVFSPDGRWIAYTTDEPGQPDVYVQPFLRAGGKYRVSPNGGRNPRWRPDGRELFYIDGDGMMTAVPVSAGDAFVAGAPKPLFRAGTLALEPTYSAYSVTRDGRRFLVNTRPETTVDTPLTVITNWASTLRK